MLCDHPSQAWHQPCVMLSRFHPRPVKTIVFKSFLRDLTATPYPVDQIVRLWITEGSEF